MDQVEKSLQEIADRLLALWKETQDVTSPIGELAALAAATLVFYRERERDKHSGKHWTDYRS